ncbi:UDP-4-amino-4,6-dideoxy-N-acetyl-beta-L-altrosamine transaminase [soil metagenome]
MNIRLFAPSFGEEELSNIKDSFDRSWVGLGPKVTQFENEWSKYIGCKTSVGLNSATAALHMALTAFGFPEGKKVLVPSLTFAATAFAPIYNHLEPVFVDCDEKTASISLDDLEKKYTKDCVAIIPVHFGGHPALMDEIIPFAKEKGLKVVEDCAHVAGASYKGKKIGTWGDIGCFSFEEKKAMTTGDGGMMCSDDTELIDPMRANRWLGIDKDTWKRSANYTDTSNMDARHWYYEIAVLGYKYNMNDLSASIGLAQLKKLDGMNEKRSKLITKYMNGMKDLKNITPILPFDPENNSYHFFGIRCAKRDEMIMHLKSKGIATGVHYMPLTLQPYFRKWRSDCPVAERIWNDFITLPLHVHLTDEEVNYILEALKEFESKL